MIDKKKARQEYKMSAREAGIYGIRNIRNGRVFVSTSLDLEKVFNGQLFQLKLGSHKNSDLQKDFNLLGEEAFSFEILEKIELNALGVKNDNPDRTSDEDIMISDSSQAMNPLQIRNKLKDLEKVWKERLKPTDASGYN
ncbi:MAG: hypothetical protein CVV64_04635 [Candidatus Wallbacteria bacterium HGW-Wallbacteria-1]|jgi:hypothetical protein|uniref:GIY-YIG domain-containing protein n=1 Tax=Candidatus Wallbacteria bacterium HGW-Wallbacteria-1 TaxID=2013854 RepID=A0A2N1PRV0_9BACT|nr:MAG: hypothetical protein CVV64_04635 [Candidatus Wallbacteria bacterium HGW-Wallbacteria-1]